MPSPEAIAEAAQASAAFQAALVRIGAATIQEALAIWRRLSATDPEGTAQAWLDDATQMILSRRGQSRELALAYYRLARALTRGTTVPDPRFPEPTYVTLGSLRTAFAELADSALPDDAGDDLYVPVEPRDTPVAPRDDAPGEVVERDDDDDDLVDMTEDELRDALEAEAEERQREWDEAEREAEEEIRIVMQAMGIGRFEKHASRLGDSPSASELQAVKDKVGFMQAASAERITLNAGRGDLHDMAGKDSRAVGFVRVSGTGTPCGFCAMLISRGLIFYSSEFSATFTADGDLYHDNCKCYAMPVFSREQYRADDGHFRINRLYARWWPEVTGNLGGREALSVWRKFFRVTEGVPEEKALEVWAAYIKKNPGWKSR